MKSKIATLLALAFAALMGFVIPVHASMYAVQATALAGGTANVAKDTTNTYTTVTIDATKQENVPLELSFKCDGTNTLNITLTFLKSIDGSTWDTSGSSALSWVVAANGTNTVTCTTNLACTGYGYFKLHTALNPAASGSVTNLSLRYAIKRVGE